MLYDPKWEVKANPLSVAAFVEWLDKKPAQETYDYYKFESCALGQWVKSLDPGAIDRDLEGDSYTYRVNGKIVNLRDPFRDIVAYHPWTFGAALERARKTLSPAE